MRPRTTPIRLIHKGALVGSALIATRSDEPYLETPLMSRRLPSTVRSLADKFGSLAAFGATAVLAMAPAPAPTDDLADAEPVAGAAAPHQAPSATEVSYETVAREVAFATPVEGYAVNSNFGMRRHPVSGKMKAHKGVDIAAPTGAPVEASAEGVVLRTGYQASGFGNFVEVRHPNGLTTVYAHLSRVEVAQGERVHQGEALGKVGSTGLSTGPHLHFEVRKDGIQMNPMRVLNRVFQAFG